jgi:hypothetical protein
VLVLGIIGTGFAYVLNYQIITSEGATVASTVTYLLPVVAIVLGVLVLHESITVITLAGIALVLAGVALTRRRVRAASGAALSSPIRLGCPRGPLDLGAIVLPPGRVVLRQIRVIGCYPRCAVQLLAQDVGVPGVPVRLREHMDQDVESTTPGIDVHQDTRPGESRARASIVASAWAHARR